jgi:chromosome partitioning protein
MVISFVGQKGGTGKSTISINISYCFSCYMGKKVLLIDADPQGSCMQWQSVRKDKTFDVIHNTKPDIHKKIKRLSKEYDIIIIDGPPGTSDTTLSILLSSNLVVVPVTPSPLDLWSAAEIKDIIKEARKHNRKLRAKILVSKGIYGTTVFMEAGEAFERYKIQVFKSEISQRIAFVKSLISGQSVIEYEPNGSAAGEIKNLYDELRGK